MTDPGAATPSALARYMPGVGMLRRYRRADFGPDFGAGLAVAAVAVPGSIANAQLAGLPPEVGLYASTLPLVAYAFFGTSRQLMVGPSAATAALVGAAVAPLAHGDAALYLSLSLALCLGVGILCLLASFMKLGALADFLSKPILVGFMNGVALSILVTQTSRLFGLSLDAAALPARLLEFVTRLPSAHLPTLALGATAIAVLVLAPKVVRFVPAPLLAMLVAGVAAHVLALDARGVTMIAAIPAGLPAWHWPAVPPGTLPTLVAEAAGLALMSFSNMMIAARGFAAKNGYAVDADREMAALGAVNIAAAVAQSFVVSGTNSRTAVADAAGGRTQVTGLVSAAAIAVVALFFTAPLQFVPTVVLAAILITAGLSLLDVAQVRLIWRIDRSEALLSLFVTAGVVLVGAIDAILLAVVLSLLRFVRLAARPKVETLGTCRGEPGFRALGAAPQVEAIPGLVLFRFHGPVVFFSADYWKREVERVAAEAAPGLRWFVLDMLPVSMVDATGIYALREAFAALRARGIEVVLAGRDAEWAAWADARGFASALEQCRMFASLDDAVAAFAALPPPAAATA